MESRHPRNRAQMALRTLKTGSVSRGNVRLKVGTRSREAGDASLGKQTLCQLSYSRSGGWGRSPCGENLPLEPGDGRAGGTRVLDAWLLAARVRCGLVGSAAVESSKVDWRWRLQAPGIAQGYWTSDVPLVPSEVRERGISENN